MAGAVRGVIGVAQDDALGPERHAVVALDEDLRGTPAGADVVEVTGLLDVAGVVEAQGVPAVGRGAGHHHGAAGVGAGGLVGGVRLDDHAVVLPGHEVPAGEMPPAAGCVRRGPCGAVLMEHMVGAPQLAQAVGVVEPARGGHEMESHLPAAAIHRFLLNLIGCSGWARGGPVRVSGSGAGAGDATGAVRARAGVRPASGGRGRLPGAGPCRVRFRTGRARARGIHPDGAVCGYATETTGSPGFTGPSASASTEA